MSRDIGFTYGTTLDDYLTGCALSAQTARNTLREDLSTATRQAESLKAELSSHEQKLTAVRQQLSSLNEHYDRLALRRENEPHLFSAPKATIYLTLSIVLLLADIAILGQVIARLLGYPWRNEDLGDRTFTQVLFSDPGRALRTFPDLLSLTAAVLLIALFYKVWRDLYLSPPSDTPDASRGWRFRIDTGLLGLSVLAVGLMALARLTIEVGQDAGALASRQPGALFPRVVSAVLGLSLPFVSVGFFVVGWDTLAHRWQFLRLATTRRILVSAGETLEATLLQSKIDASLADQKRVTLESPQHLEEVLDQSKLEFDEGYRNGVAQLLDTSPGASLFVRLQPIAIRKMFYRQTSASSQ